jgi:L-ascorbate metabolism protein UlaG (beta-lactamase superfamily)
MDIIYLGHSSFHIKGKTASVVTDPFDAASVGFRFPRTEATIVTISHAHDDHNKSELVSGVKKIISGPGEYEVDGISVIGLPTYHDNMKGAERGRNTVYVYEVDGLRLAHLGDLGHTLSEETISAMGDIDVLMIPVGGKYTIDAKEAAEVVRLIEPNIVIPMHYQVPGLNPQMFSELADEKAFITELGFTARREKKLTLKQGLLPTETQEIVTLEII